MTMLEMSPTDAMPENMRQIFDQCIKILGSRSQSSIGSATVVLVMPGMSKASATRRRLAGRKSPMGEIVADGDRNTQIVSFKIIELLAWMSANGLVAAKAAR